MSNHIAKFGTLVECELSHVIHNSQRGIDDVVNDFLDTIPIYITRMSLHRLLFDMFERAFLGFTAYWFIRICRRWMETRHYVCVSTYLMEIGHERSHCFRELSGHCSNASHHRREIRSRCASNRYHTRFQTMVPDELARRNATITSPIDCRTVTFESRRAGETRQESQTNARSLVSHE